jgi:DNA-binding response OmpR family regulator
VDTYQPGLKILIIGKNKLTKRVLNAFENYNVFVTCIPDATEAVSLFRKETFDVTLIDAYILHLEEVCQSINFINRTYAALLVNGTDQDVLTARLLKIDMFLFDDFDQPETIEKLQTVSRRKNDPVISPRILIVEDEPYIARAIDVSLRRHWPFADIYHAACGKDGIRYCRLKLLDIILLDIKLPDINGFEVLKAVRCFTSVPIIMTTADRVQEDIIQTLSSGANDYLLKPFTQEDLILRITKQLDPESNPKEVLA